MQNKYGQSQSISIDLIDDPRFAIRTRVNDERIADLVSSIKSFGILQPLLVRPNGSRFEVIAGHRRLIAGRIAGLVVVPCIVCSVSDVDAEILKLHENICREDVNVVDEAIFLAGVREKQDLTVGELAKLIGRSESYVSDRLEMQNWDPAILNAVHDDSISRAAGYWLNRIDDPAIRNDWLGIACRGGVSAIQAQYWYNQYLQNRLPEAPTEQQVEDVKTHVVAPVKFVKCSMCGSDIPLVDAILVYAHQHCVDYWKMQLKVNADAEKEKKPE